MRTSFSALKLFVSAATILTALAFALLGSFSASAHSLTQGIRVGRAPTGHHGSTFDSTSTNWSGYASTGTTYSDVKGTWVEPTATCSGRSTAYSSFWVGIDGDGTNSVEQLGTDADCSRGTPTYYGWWEMYPNPSYEISPSTYPVKPGDTLTAEVSVSGTNYTLTLSSSRGWNFKTTKSASAANGSAEWIAEAPSSGSGVLPLANFGTVNFSNCTANGKAISANPNVDEITMETSGGTVKAQPSGLNGSGNGFSDTWHHS
jgi:hypothetical protein